MASYVIVAQGEGAQAMLISPVEDIHEAAHRFMCFCGVPWKQCTSEGITRDLLDIDNLEEWDRDESGEPFAIHWRSETGTISIYRLMEREGINGN